MKFGPDIELEDAADKLLRESETKRGELRSEYGVLTMDAEEHVLRQELSLDDLWLRGLVPE